MAKILKAENIQTDLLGSNGNSAFSLQRNSSSLLTLNTNDCVGVNTTSPSHLFEVRGSSFPKICITSDDQSIDTGATFRIDLKNASSSLFEAGAISVRHAASNQTAAGESSYMSFFTRNAGTVAEKMRILNTGSVGIGTTNPSTRLHVAGGDIRLDDNSTLSWGGTANTILGNNASNYLRFTTNSTIRMVIDNAGLVGIGTTNPAVELTVDNATNPEIGLYTSGTERVKFSTAGSAQSVLAINVAGAERFRIDSSGNVILGNGDVDTTPANGFLRVTNASGTNTSGSSITISAGAGTGTGAGGDIILRTAPAGSSGSSLNTLTERLRIDSSGNVGIGTASPAAKLNVYDASSSIFSLQGDSTTQVIANRASTDATSPTVVLRKSRGSIASPTAVATSDVIGDLSFQAFGGTANRNLSRIRGSVETYVSDTDISSNLIFQTSSAGGVTATERMRIDSSGNVGIGTASPAAKLDVNGAVKINGTLTFSDGSTQSTRAAIGFRNRIINGDCRIDQRNAGASQTFTAGAALAYSIDRFYGYCTGANVTGQRVAGTTPNEFAYRFTGAASVTAIGFGTRLEATNTFDLAGSTATLSVQLANSLLTTVTWTAFRANSADAFGTLSSPTRTQIGTGTFTVTSSLATYSAQISVPSAATTGIEIVFTVGAQTSGTWTIDNVQLEAGATATEFERRPIGTELALCQRYYWKSFGQSVVPSNGTGDYVGSIGFNHVNGNIGQGMCYFPCTMRAIPIITLFNPRVGGAAGQVTDSANDDSASRATLLSERSFAVDNTGTTNSNSSRVYVHAVASAEL